MVEEVHLKQEGCVWAEEAPHHVQQLPRRHNAREQRVDLLELVNQLHLDEGCLLYVHQLHAVLPRVQLEVQIVLLREQIAVD